MILILGRKGGTAVSFAAVSTNYCLAAPVEFGWAQGRFPPFPQCACPLDPRTPPFPVTGGRNRRFLCGSEYHLLPRCPRRVRQGTGAVPSLPPVRVSSQPPYSSISCEEPAVSLRGPEEQ